MNKHERRHFHRILFNAGCLIRHSDKSWNTQVLDISLAGALLQRPPDWTGNTGMSADIVVHLDDGTVIVMTGSLKHVEPDRLGFGWEYLDLESATHLRRLLELNLGDEALLHRELLELGTRN